MATMIPIPSQVLAPHGAVRDAPSQKDSTRHIGGCCTFFGPSDGLAAADYFFEAQHAFLALQPLSLTAPMLAAPVIGQDFGAEHSLLLEQSFLAEQPLTAPMLAFFEHDDEQLLLQASPTAPIEASFGAEHSDLASEQADFSAQQAVPHSPTAPGLALVVLPVVAQPRRAHERKRAAMPVTRIMRLTPWAV